MKLQELIDTKFKDTSTNGEHHWTTRTDNINSTYDREHPTTGQYGYVEPDEEDPHQIIKQYKRSFGRKDAYLTYIEEIAKNKLAGENPFFPRVYDVERQTDVLQKTKPTFKMEKLMNSTDLDSNIMYRLGKSLFDNFDQYLKTSPVNINDEHRMARVIGYIMDKMLETGNFKDCKNTYLISALEFIYMIIKNNQKYDFFPDLHVHNYMIRPTPTGPQLVLTDPIGG